MGHKPWPRTGEVSPQCAVDTLQDTPQSTKQRPELNDMVNDVITTVDYIKTRPLKAHFFSAKTWAPTKQPFCFTASVTMTVTWEGAVPGL